MSKVNPKYKGKSMFLHLEGNSESSLSRGRLCTALLPKDFPISPLAPGHLSYIQLRTVKNHRKFYSGKIHTWKNIKKMSSMTIWTGAHS